jgi:hypothetical protein
MGTEAFAAPGKFWRGNIHTHSTRSDGKLPPEEVCRRYREAGYDFLCLSDHFLPQYGFPIVDTRPFRTNSFTTILGAEIHAPKNSHGEVWHVLAAGLPDDFAPTGEGESAEALGARANAAGAFVGIAHPQWSSLSVEDGRAMAPMLMLWKSGTPAARWNRAEATGHTCLTSCSRKAFASRLTPQTTPTSVIRMPSAAG